MADPLRIRHLDQLERAGLIEIAEYRPLARGKVERVYTPVVTEPPSDAANPAEMAELLGAMLDATRADINAAYRSRQGGGRREVDLHRGVLRLTDEALAELRGHIERLASRFGDRDAPGVWSRPVKRAPASNSTAFWRTCRVRLNSPRHLPA
ncbi:hypothetical protein [Streptomyces sp. NPDC101776]|uniref:hypothetical protein n=1 Tax=Streptomyces sp. NPDC101776 TaxID=3366146 RepID=UPI003808D543